MSAGATAKSINEPLNVGDVVLDRYRVIERKAVGGHSVVYRGEDERLARPVCIKVFHQRKQREGVYRTSYQHFVQEAFALSKLTHPNTLRIYDFGHLGPGESNPEDPGAPFQVSEYMNAGTLSAHVRDRGALPVEQAARMLAGLCGALGEAHRHGIVHRDIKPQNILFLQSGDSRTVKLADFGIAKFRGADGASLQYQADDTKIIAGSALRMLSPVWAAPEQMTGDAVGPFSDIYSMALIGCYMLTGRALFLCRDPDDAYRMRIESDRHIEQAFQGSAVDARFVELIKQGCRLNPNERPASVQALATGFAAALSNVARPRFMAPPTVLDRPGDRPAVERKPPIRLKRNDLPRALGDREVSFVPMERGSAVLDTPHAQIRLTLMRANDELVVHVKPLTCFVSSDGRRASSAVQVSETSFLNLMLPNRRAIARARVCFGRAAAGHTVFALDATEVALSHEEFGTIVAFDFGPGSRCFFSFTGTAQPSELGRSRSGGKA